MRCARRTWTQADSSTPYRTETEPTNNGCKCEAPFIFQMAFLFGFCISFRFVLFFVVPN